MRWIHTPADRAFVESLASAMAVGPTLRGADNECTRQILAPLLIRRGITDAESAANYLSPSLSHLHAPEQMTGLSTAVDRVEAAIER